jgi:hypothetical protein
MTIELWRYDELRKTWPDLEVVQAFEGFWDEILGPAWDPESHWHGWKLLIPGRKPVTLDPRAVGSAALYALVERRHERGFADRMARLHAAAPDGEPLDLLPFLAIEPTFGCIADMMQAVRAAFSVAVPPSHLGRIGATLPRPDDATFTLATCSGAYPNGAGCMTHVAEWNIDLYAPERVHIAIEASDEEGSPTSWSITVRHDPQARVDGLLAALSQQGHFPKAHPIRLDAV